MHSQQPDSKKNVAPEIVEMGWYDIVKSIKNLADSKQIPLRIRKLKKAWVPLIKNIENLIKETRSKYENTPEPSTATEKRTRENIESFIQKAQHFFEKAQKFDKTKDYDFYRVNNLESMLKITNNPHITSAVIIYKERNEYKARLFSAEEQKFNTTIAINDKFYNKSIASLKPNAEGEVELDEKNYDQVEAIIGEIIKKANSGTSLNIPLPITDTKFIASGIAQLAQELPDFLAHFEKLGLESILQEKLDSFKKHLDTDFVEMLSTLLPTEMITEIKKEVLDHLTEENFKNLSQDKKALALAFMDIFNEACKLAFVAMDKTEIKMDLKPGSLSTELLIADRKPLANICKAFNQTYVKYLSVAGYSIKENQLFPYHNAIQQNRVAMLKQMGPQDSTQRTRLIKAIDPAFNQTIKTSNEEAINLAQLLSFTQSKLVENYQRVKTLSERFQSSKGPKTDFSKHYASAKNLLQETDKLLHKILDKQVYEHFFESKDLEPAASSHWIEQMGTAFKKLKKTVATIDALQAELVIENQFETPYAHLKRRTEILDSLAKVGIELIVSIDDLKNNTSLQEVSTAIPFKDLISLKSIAKVEDKLKTTVSAIKTHIQKELGKSHSQALVTLYDKITTIAADLKPLKATLANLDDDSLKDDFYKKIHTIHFVQQHFTRLMAIFSNLPHAIQLLTQLSKNEALKATIEINKFLLEITLLIDKLELELHLKEGLIADPFNKEIKDFYAIVKKLGYDFNPEERYPYAKIIAKQRAELLEKASGMQASLIQGRMGKNDSLKEDFAERIEVTAVTEKLTALLETHISTLKNERKIQLISQLIEKIKTDQPHKNGLIPFQKHLDFVKQKNMADFHLLYTGETRKILKTLEHSGSTRKDLLHQLNLELGALKKSRAKSGYFFRISQARKLEDRINVCEKLHKLLQKHLSVQDAYLSLDLSEQNILKKYDTALLKRIKKIDKTITEENIEKRILNFSPFEEIATIPTDRTQTDEYKYAKHLIDIRIKELQNTIYLTDTRNKKIELLKELKKNLAHFSLDIAIKNIQQKKPTDYHLLFEGTTGKKFLSIQHAYLSKNELIQYIDIEITDLKHQRFENLLVFSYSRKADLEAQIQALLQLKETITKMEKENVSDIISNLGGHDKILQKLGTKLVSDLSEFRKFSNK